LLRFLREGGLRYAGGLIALALVLRYVSVINGANPRDLSYWTIVGRIDQFVLGIVLGLYYRPVDSSIRARLIALAAATLAVIGTLYGLHVLGGYRLICAWKIGWPTFEAVLWVLFIRTYLDVADWIPQRLSDSLCALGALSFSIYMTHRIV